MGVVDERGGRGVGIGLRWHHHGPRVELRGWVDGLRADSEPHVRSRTYAATLTATDNAGATATQSRNVTVAQAPRDDEGKLSLSLPAMTKGNCRSTWVTWAARARIRKPPGRPS